MATEKQHKTLTSKVVTKLMASTDTVPAGRGAWQAIGLAAPEATVPGWHPDFPCMPQAAEVHPSRLLPCCRSQQHLGAHQPGFTLPRRAAALRQLIHGPLSWRWESIPGCQLSPSVLLPLPELEPSDSNQLQHSSTPLLWS